jgi:5'-phosphate synthase pdxT subunit
VKRRPTWGTCAGLILLAESANRTKKGGQELIGGLDVRVDRNHFGRQVESFVTNMDLPFLSLSNATTTTPFRGVFIRAPIVEKVLKRTVGIQESEAADIEGTVVAPSRAAETSVKKELLEGEVEVLARLPKTEGKEEEEGRIVAVRQGNCFGTSFHPELTSDERLHVWWLGEIVKGYSGGRSDT